MLSMMPFSAITCSLYSTRSFVASTLSGVPSVSLLTAASNISMQSKAHDKRSLYVLIMLQSFSKFVTTVSPSAA